MADIPGIIEGAAEGKGLGHYCLRHIERNSILLFGIPADVKDVKEAFEVLYNELKKYNPELLDKEYMVVLSKADLLDEELKKEYAAEMHSLFKEIPHLIISGVSQYQLTELKVVLWKLITKEDDYKTLFFIFSFLGWICSRAGQHSHREVSISNRCHLSKPNQNFGRTIRVH